jgi:hypothetical protein
VWWSREQAVWWSRDAGVTGGRVKSGERGDSRRRDRGGCEMGMLYRDLDQGQNHSHTRTHAHSVIASDTAITPAMEPGNELDVATNG